MSFSPGDLFLLSNSAVLILRKNNFYANLWVCLVTRKNYSQITNVSDTELRHMTAENMMLRRW